MLVEITLKAWTDIFQTIENLEGLNFNSSIEALLKWNLVHDVYYYCFTNSSLFYIML